MLVVSSSHMFFFVCSGLFLVFEFPVVVRRLSLSFSLFFSFAWYDVIIFNNYLNYSFYPPHISIFVLTFESSCVPAHLNTNV